MTASAALAIIPANRPRPRRVVPLPGPIPVPSAAYTLDFDRLAGWSPLIPDVEPVAIGDVVIGEVVSVGEHTQVQNRSGRRHQISVGQIGLFVFGNRYATGAFEARIPDTIPEMVDLVNVSGTVAIVRSATSTVQTPTRVRVLGRAVDGEDQPISTLDSPVLSPRSKMKAFPRAKLILVVGTSMDSGKSTAAVAIARALTSQGSTVKASKVTGTASLREILHMEDAGAVTVNDFTYLGYPSTYMLDADTVLGIFNTLDLAVANKPENYWIVEIADGIQQRETAILLRSADVQHRIHRLVFCAGDPLGAIGGISVLDSSYGLSPDLIAGLVGSSPLARMELAQNIDLPVIDSLTSTPQRIARFVR